MEYWECDSAALPSYSKQSPSHIHELRASHGKVYSPGNGWAYVYETSKFLLFLEGRKQIDVAPYFKENWGKLSPERRIAIEATMPLEVQLTQGGLSTSVLEFWLQRAMAANASPTPRKEAVAK